jgi:tryptophan-rich sensory protein
VPQDDQRMTKGTIWAFVICLGAAALEGLLAGGGVRRRLAELLQPRYSPPFGVWVGIGICYYVICFIVLARLIDAARTPLWLATFFLIVALLVGNALWSFVFFRLRNLEASAVITVVYVPVALGLAVLLSRLDSVAVWILLPYLLYLPYAIWWVLSLRRLNSKARVEAA